jgi:hypothetical protein
MPINISEAEARAGLRHLSAPRIIAELSKASPSEDNIEFFLDILQRSNDTFFKYPHAEHERSRDESRAYFEYRRSDDDIYDWIANERQKEYIMQNFAELRFETFVEKKAAGISAGAKLFPDQFVNVHEINSAGFLPTLLGVDISNDSTLYSRCGWLSGCVRIQHLVKLLRRILKAGSLRVSEI